MNRHFALLGTSSAAIGVGAGAFGAHALGTRLAPELLDVFETAARYQMYHALALLIVAVVAGRWPHVLVRASGWLFVTGTLLFSGSLYALALTGVRGLGAVTPVGGVCFLAGWLCLGMAATRAPSPLRPSQ